MRIIHIATCLMLTAVVATATAATRDGVTLPDSIKELL